MTSRVGSAATLVHAFVASRIDYCNAVLAYAPTATTEKLQRVLNAAAWVVTGTKKFERGRGFFTLSFIGSMYQSESCTSSVSWCIAVYMVKRRSTCSTSANQSLMSRHGVISDLLVGDCWTYRTGGGVHLPGGLSLWLARWCGTRCRTTSETRQSAETLSAST